ncbi:MAG: hypothetical protein EP343_05900 [Deltaproteobacteria bacterium]|nr:MAG: hypothetical protein EP343_05900 [Deltaproteobacteria bacterium]
MQLFVTFGQCLVAVLLTLAVLFLGFVASLRWLPREERLLRWSATGIGGFGFLIVVGLVLLRLGIFRWYVALPLPLLCACLAYRWLLPFSKAREALREDLHTAWVACSKTVRTEHPWLLLVFAVMVLLALRTLLLPPLAWDTLTYHAFKAGVYVKTGSFEMPLIPSGWMWYRLFPPGGEVLQAWAMLPFHHDGFYIVVDVFVFLFASLAIYTIAQRVVGLRHDLSLLGVGLVFSMPTMWRAIGSGYVDVLLCSSLCFAVVFTWVYATSEDEAFRWRCLVLSWSSMGVALSVKLTAYPVVALLLLSQGWIAWRTLGQLVPYLKRFVLGALLLGAFTLPWMSYNISETGLPLSPYPISVAGLSLGKAPPSLQEYSKLPFRKTAYTWKGEGYALLKTFLPMNKRGHLLWSTRYPTLGGATLLLLLFFPFGWLLLWRRSRLSTLFISIIMAGVLAGFYHSGFAIIRIGWATSNGRFLLGLVWVALLLVLLFLAPRLERFPQLTWVLAALCLWNVWDVVLYINPEEWPWLGGLFVGGVVGLTFAYGFYRWLKNVLWLRWSAWMLLGTCALVGVLTLKHSFRVEAYSSSLVLHGVTRYWHGCFKAFEQRRRETIAVTAGHLPQHDNWFLYPWMGRYLQHQVLYVSPLRTKSVIDFQRGYHQRYWKLFDQKLWVKRLRQQGVTFVMALFPNSLELSWMSRRTDLFRPVATVPNSWGCFRLLPKPLSKD